MIRAARECSVKDTRRGHPGRFQVSANLPTNDHIDRETVHRSSVSRHRSQRCARDRVYARGEQIREASTAFPLVLSETVKLGLAHDFKDLRAQWQCAISSSSKVEKAGKYGSPTCFSQKRIWEPTL